MAKTHNSKKLLSASMWKAFYLDDQVTIFDKDGRRVPGVVKWACPRKEYGSTSSQEYIIGIETVRIDGMDGVMYRI